jgi:VWFA-related protein
MRRALQAAWFGLALTTAAEPPSQQPPVFRASVESVFVDVFVSRDGEPVTGLGPERFELRDNGVRQDFAMVAAEAVPLTVVLVFDTSGSVSGLKLDALRAASRAFLETVSATSEAALVTFSHEIRIAAPLSRDRARVSRALQLVNPTGSSAVMDGLYAGLQIAGNARALVVLFSDGQDNLSWLSAPEVAAVAERSNAIVHVVGFLAEGAPVDTSGSSSQAGRPPFEPDYVRALRQIAEATGGRFWGVGSPDRLREAFARLASVVNARYVLRFEPQGVPRPGWHAVEVKLRGVKGRVHARRGYFVAPAR